MATDPPRRLMRKHGEDSEERRVYYGGMDDQKDADYADSESDLAFSEWTQRGDFGGQLEGR